MIETIDGLVPVYASDGAEVLGLFADGEVRRLFTRRQATVVENRTGRFVMASSALAQEQIAPRAVRRIQTSPKFYRHQTVGEFRVPQHVASRCTSFYDGRRLPRGMRPEICPHSV